MTTLPKNWIINRPRLDNKERELLFILAKSAGYIISSTINDFLDPDYNPYTDRHHSVPSSSLLTKDSTPGLWAYYRGYRKYDSYIGCGGIYVQEWSEDMLKKETNLSYNTVIETFKHIIKNRKI